MAHQEEGVVEAFVGGVAAGDSEVAAGVSEVSVLFFQLP